jgi:hypothetical protein
VLEYTGVQRNNKKSILPLVRTRRSHWQILRDDDAAAGEAPRPWGPAHRPEQPEQRYATGTASSPFSPSTVDHLLAPLLRTSVTQCTAIAARARIAGTPCSKHREARRKQLDEWREKKAEQAKKKAEQAARKAAASTQVGERQTASSAGGSRRDSTALRRRESGMAPHGSYAGVQAIFKSPPPAPVALARASAAAVAGADVTEEVLVVGASSSPMRQQHQHEVAAVAARQQEQVDSWVAAEKQRTRDELATVMRGVSAAKQQEEEAAAAFKQKMAAGHSSGDGPRPSLDGCLPQPVFEPDPSQSLALLAKQGMPPPPAPGGGGGGGGGSSSSRLSMHSRSAVHERLHASTPSRSRRESTSRCGGGRGCRSPPATCARQFGRLDGTAVLW